MKPHLGHFRMILKCLKNREITAGNGANLPDTVGDYVIKGTKGELYPCKPDIFQEIYNRYVPLSPLHEEPVTLGGKNEERAKM
mgnify:CR=1 FL=1